MATDEHALSFNYYLSKHNMIIQTLRRLRARRSAAGDKKRVAMQNIFLIAIAYATSVAESFGTHVTRQVGRNLVRVTFFHLLSGPREQEHAESLIIG